MILESSFGPAMRPGMKISKGKTFSQLGDKEPAAPHLLHKIKLEITRNRAILMQIC
jgi:hypothetical protein